MRLYCTQNNGACDTCSLSNYGRDCKNEKIFLGLDICDSCGATASECNCGDFVSTAPLNETEKRLLSSRTRKPSIEEIADFWSKN